MGSLKKAGHKELFPSPPDPVMIEFNRLESIIKDKERELGFANNEIRALKITEIMKDKAVMELSNELTKMDEKLRSTEKQLEEKNLEVKKLSNEKKATMVAQFATEAALRRVHANQKDEESVSLEAIVGPLQSDIKKYKNEISVVREEKKALERVTKSKEMALVEADKILQSAVERALVVESVQNQNLELRKKIEILQEENKLLDKTNRQKVAEVEKLAQTIHELEESLLASGAAQNTIHDYRRRVSELNEEKKDLERELAKVKVSANWVATAVANEWKDENDKVIPVKQWLDERRYLQGEIQRLQDKLAISERKAKAEAQLKEKVTLRLKTLEEGLKHVPSLSSMKQHENTKLGLPLQGGPKRRPVSQPRASLIANRIPTPQQPNSAFEGVETTRSIQRATVSKMTPIYEENLARKTSQDPRSKFSNDCGKENARIKAHQNRHAGEIISKESVITQEAESYADVNTENKDASEEGLSDIVSGFLYDRLQKEVISLRKSLEQKDEVANAKEEEIQILSRKVDAIMKAREVESRNAKRENANTEKEPIAVQSNNIQRRNRSSSSSNSKRSIKHQEASTSLRGLNG